MPDIELLNILQISCTTISTKTEEKGPNYNQNTINAGSEQCHVNTGSEKDCDEKDKDVDSCTNTDNSLNSNNSPCSTSLPMVEDNVADYLLSGTIETNNKIEYFLPGPNNVVDKEQVPL